MVVPSDRLAIRFTEQGNRTVNGVWLNISAVAGTPPIYRIGLQGDSAGIPDGSYIQSTDYDHAGGGTGWVKVDLPEAALTDGVIYHLVVEYLSGTIDSGNRIQFHADQQLFTYIPLTVMDDPNLVMNSWFNDTQWFAP